MRVRRSAQKGWGSWIESKNPRDKVIKGRKKRQGKIELSPFVINSGRITRKSPRKILISPLLIHFSPPAQVRVFHPAHVDSSLSDFQSAEWGKSSSAPSLIYLNHIIIMKFIRWKKSNQISSFAMRRQRSNLEAKYLNENDINPRTHILNLFFLLQLPPAIMCE